MKTNKETLLEIEKILVEAFKKIKALENQPGSDGKILATLSKTKEGLSSLISAVETELVNLGGE